MKSKYCIFILSYGRAKTLYTMDTLKSYNMTDDVYIVCSDDDKTLDEYIQIYGRDKVLIFNKDKVEVDTMDLRQNKAVCVYARQKCFDFCEQLGYQYFIELDDDYIYFAHRYEKNNKLYGVLLDDLKKAFDIMVCWYDKHQNVSSLSIAQTGDYIGGVKSTMFNKKVVRKSMNLWILSPERKINFIGSMNDDVSTYTSLGNQGKIFLTIDDIHLKQKPTQKLAGGMSELYKSMGTYLKSFYSVMRLPSAIRVGKLQNRIHHKVYWNYCVPKILSDKYKKGEH